MSFLGSGYIFKNRWHIVTANSFLFSNPLARGISKTCLHPAADFDASGVIFSVLVVLVVVIIVILAVQNKIAKPPGEYAKPNQDPINLAGMFIKYRGECCANLHFGRF